MIHTDEDDEFARIGKNPIGFTARCRNFVLDFSGEKSNFPLAIYFK